MKTYISLIILPSYLLIVGIQEIKQHKILNCKTQWKFRTIRAHKKTSSILRIPSSVSIWVLNNLFIAQTKKVCELMKVHSSKILRNHRNQIGHSKMCRGQDQHKSLVIIDFHIKVWICLKVLIRKHPIFLKAFWNQIRKEMLLLKTAFLEILINRIQGLNNLRRDRHNS